MSEYSNANNEKTMSGNLKEVYADKKKKKFKKIKSILGK